MAEITSKVQKQIAPNGGVLMIGVTGTTAADGDIITVSELTTIQGCIGFSTTGVAASYSFPVSSNVITLNNAGALSWNFIVWGY